MLLTVMNATSAYMAEDAHAFHKTVTTQCKAILLEQLHYNQWRLILLYYFLAPADTA